MLGVTAPSDPRVTMPASSGEMAIVCEPLPVMDTSRSRGSHHVVRGKTIAGVTAEAREVLEQFLRRSLSESAADHRPEVRRRPRKQLGTITENGADVPDAASTSAEGRPHGGSSDDGLDVVDGFVLDRLGRGDGRDLPESRPSLRSGGDHRQDSVRTVTDTEQSIRSAPLRNVPNLSIGKIAEPEESDLSDVENNEDSAGSRVGSSEQASKKKKSGFKRARERLRALFSRQRDGSMPRDKKRQRDAGATLPTSEKRNWFGSSLRRKRKQVMVEGGPTEDGSLGSGSAEWKRKEKSRTMGADDNRTGSRASQAKTRNLISSLQKRVSSFRLKRNSSRAETPSTPVSQSGDEIGIHPLTNSQHKILDKYAVNGDTTTSSADAAATTSDAVPHAANFGHSGHHSIRENLHLSLTIPAKPVIQSTADTVLSASLCERTKSWKFIDEDEVDGGEDEDEVDGFFSSRPVIKPDDTVDAGMMGAAAGETRVDAKMLSHATERPFAEKSPTEKDELYEQIASQLAGIGDNYIIRSPGSRSGASGDCEAGAASSMNSLASALLQNATYSSFRQVISQAVANESCFNQIALMYRLSSAAVNLAGPSTTLVNKIKDMTLNYFEENFASWVLERGGWESLAEDGATTDSGVD